MNKTAIIAKVTVVVSIITVTLLSSCSKLEYQAVHSDIKRCSDMLYEVTYSDYTTVVPNNRYGDMAGDMGCSSVRNGDFVGRNFDYFMNQCPTFVIHTTAKEGRYATIGVGRLANINEKDIKAGLPKEKLDFLPWALLDGMNEKGLVVNTNVLSRADWGKPDHTGTQKGLPELNVLFTPRALLDNCSDVKGALKYLNEHNITPLNSKKMNLQIMISDPKETYVVEFINDTIVARPQNIMTNYHIFYENIPDHAMGVERYQILEESYSMGGDSMQGMWELMKKVRYTNLYDYPTYIWYSELSSDEYPYSELDNNKKSIEAELEGIAAAWEVVKEFVKKNGLPETTQFWDTAHNSIYDIRNKKLWVTVHEWYDKVKEFSL